AALVDQRLLELLLPRGEHVRGLRQEPRALGMGQRGPRRLRLGGRLDRGARIGPRRIGDRRVRRAGGGVVDRKLGVVLGRLASAVDIKDAWIRAHSMTPDCYSVRAEPR